MENQKLTDLLTFYRQAQAFGKLVKFSKKFDEAFNERLASALEEVLLPLYQALMEACPSKDILIRIEKDSDRPFVAVADPEAVSMLDGPGTLFNLILEPLKRLQVTLPNGEVLDGENSTTVFAQTIAYLGVEKVAELGIESARNHIPLLSRTPFEERNQRRLGDYYLYVNTSTKTKYDQLLTIAQSFPDIDLKIELIEK